MKDIAYHQLNTLVRVKENELLSTEKMEKLILAKNFAEIKQILLSTVYAPAVTQDHFEKNFEQYDKENQEEFFRWLYTYAPEPDLISLYTLEYTFHNLKILTKAKQTQNDFDHLFLPDGKYSLDTIKSAVYTKNSSVLESELLSAVIEVDEYLQENRHWFGLDFIYDRCFLQEQRRRSRKLDYPVVQTIFSSMQDLYNLSMMARGIAQKRSKRFMKAVITSFGQISQETLFSYADTSLEEYSQYLLKCPYGHVLKEAIREGSVLDFVVFSRLRDDYLTDLYKMAKTMPFGPLPVMAFIHAKTIEQKNLRLLFVGKRHRFSQEQIRERMRICYV
ncbi:V-type ATPase subunit C [Clostridia bacterium]|nr:V-type ATPase subunit C [Clostridia bacterium]